MATIQPTTTPPHLLVRPITGADAALRIHRAALGTHPYVPQRERATASLI
jgi:hypothetical protein